MRNKLNIILQVVNILFLLVVHLFRLVTVIYALQKHTMVKLHRILPLQMSTTNSLLQILVDCIKNIPESMVLIYLVQHSTTSMTG